MFSKEEIREGIEKHGPWFYAFDFGHGLVTKSNEFKASVRETGVTSLATYPSPKALLFMLRQAYK